MFLYRRQPLNRAARDVQNSSGPLLAQYDGLLVQFFACGTLGVEPGGGATRRGEHVGYASVAVPMPGQIGPRSLHDLARTDASFVFERVRRAHTNDPPHTMISQTSADRSG